MRLMHKTKQATNKNENQHCVRPQWYQRQALVRSTNRKWTAMFLHALHVWAFAKGSKQSSWKFDRETTRIAWDSSELTRKTRRRIEPEVCEAMCALDSVKGDKSANNSAYLLFIKSWSKILSKSSQTQKSSFATSVHIHLLYQRSLSFIKWGKLLVQTTCRTEISGISWKPSTVLNCKLINQICILLLFTRCNYGFR